MSATPASPYGPKADPGPPGLAAKLLGFCEKLRNEGLAVGTSEILDAFAALEQVGWTSQDDFREALASTIAKSQDDRRVFELLFDRHFFRAAEAEAVQQGVTERAERAATDAGERLDIDQLSEAIREAMLAGDEGRLRDLARLAIATFGAGEGSGVVRLPFGGIQFTGVTGVDVQRIRRSLDLSAGVQPSAPDGAGERPPINREQLSRFERHLRRELERDLIERTQTLPPSRPLAELDRALPTSPTQDLAAVHRAVSQMKRRLATLGHEQRGRGKGQHVDVRRTMRASLETGGVPLRLRYRPKRPRRPEIYVLCDVSTSVTSASVFFLSVLHALHDSFRKLRSFVFIERISEVTEVFEHERDFAVVAQRISSEGGVADVSGYTDYGRVWLEFLTQISDDLDPRSTVIVLGDARTNGREPHAEVFAQVAERAGRLFWLNPEPKLYWNYGDSVMAAYERYCDGAFECWTTRHLENFVNVVAGGVPAGE
ncbi:MAG: VWA domain-containing protein [Solirubrobacterales bacterium]